MQSENLFLNHIEMPGPKQIHRGACKEISANGKFEEEYLKVHGASVCMVPGVSELVE